jgi:hypothetical protein
VHRLQAARAGFAELPVDTQAPSTTLPTPVALEA